MSFTDQKPRKTMEKDLSASWSGSCKNFRCFLCGYRFKIGDTWRWVCGNSRTFADDNKTFGVCNFITCVICDGDDVLDRWIKANEEAHQRFWWLLRY
jgi:hypothetical protein